MMGIGIVLVVMALVLLIMMMLMMVVMGVLRVAVTVLKEADVGRATAAEAVVLLKIENKN